MFTAVKPRVERRIAAFRAATTAWGLFKRTKYRERRSSLVVPAPTESSLAPCPTTAQAPILKVWLFGNLAPVANCRNFIVPLEAPTTLRAFLDEMAERFGPAFRERVMQENGELYSYCRIFLNGFPVSDLDDSIDPKNGVANLELIVLSSLEGG